MKKMELTQNWSYIRKDNLSFVNYKFISTNKKPIACAMGNFIYYFLLSTFELSATFEFFLS